MTNSVPFSHSQTQRIVAAREAARYGERGDVDRILANEFGCAETTIRNCYARATGRDERPRRRRASARKDFSAFVECAKAHMETIPLFGDRRRSRSAGYDHAMRKGIQPAPSRAYFHFLMRESAAPVTPPQQLWAEHPMAVVQVDWSAAKRISVVGETEKGGDWILKLLSPEDGDADKSDRGGGKHKPIRNQAGLRLGYVAVADMHSGAIDVRGRMVKGENAQDTHNAIFEILRDTTTPVRGVPDAIWCDNGKWYSPRLAEQMGRELGVAVVNGEPYESQARGLVEAVFKNLQNSFELALYSLLEDAGGTLKFSEFERLLASAVRDLNDRAAPHQVVEGESREEAFNSRYPADARQVPKDYDTTLYKKAPGGPGSGKGGMRKVSKGRIQLTINKQKCFYLAPKIKGIEGQGVHVWIPMAHDDRSHVRITAADGREYVCKMQQPHIVGSEKVERIPQGLLTPTHGTLANAAAQSDSPHRARSRPNPQASPKESLKVAS